MCESSSEEYFAAALKDSRAGNDVSAESQEDSQGALAASNALVVWAAEAHENHESEEDLPACEISILTHDPHFYP